MESQGEGRALHLGFDPGANAGWASDIGGGGELRWGTEDFSLKRVSTEGLRWLNFTRWLEEHLRPAKIACEHERRRYPNVVIAYEEQNNFDRHNSSSADVGKIMVGMLLEFCERHLIACEAVPLGRVKTFAIPARPRPKKGDPKLGPIDRGKDAMIEAARARLVLDHGAIVGSTGNGITSPIKAHYGGPPLTEHEADALWLYWFAKEKYGECK